MQIDYFNFDNSVRNNERAIFFNQGAVTVEVQIQLKFFNHQIKDKGCNKSPFNPRHSNNKSNERSG